VRYPSVTPSRIAVLRPADRAAIPPVKELLRSVVKTYVESDGIAYTLHASRSSITRFGHPIALVQVY
jgi:hypothetical protein